MNGIFKVVHPKGEIEVNISEFFTTQTAKAKKLFAIAQRNCTEDQRMELLDALTGLAYLVQTDVVVADAALCKPELEQEEFNALIRRYLDYAKKRACLAKNIRILREMKWLVW